MSDDLDGRRASRRESYRRRDVLGVLGAAGALALAGCSSDGDSGDGGDGGGVNTDTESADSGGVREPDTTANQSDGGRSGGGDGRVNCASPSFAYRTATFTPSTGDVTLQTSVPERGEVRKTTGLTVQIYYRNYRTDAVSLHATYMMAGTVDEAADGMTGTEVTDEYDPAVPGTRVFRSNSDEGSRLLRVLLPADEAYFTVRVMIGERACPDGTAVAATEMIDALQPAG